MERALTRVLTAGRRAPGEGRQICEDSVRAWWPDGSGDLDLDAVLVASELITNAFEAAAGTIRLELSARDDRLRIAVVDDAAGLPDLSDERLFGRGLTIVSRLRTDWGTEVRDDGTKVVWVELAALVEPALHLPASRIAE